LLDFGLWRQWNTQYFLFPTTETRELLPVCKKTPKNRRSPHVGPSKISSLPAKTISLQKRHMNMKSRTDWKRTAASSILVIAFFGMMFGSKFASLHRLNSFWRADEYADREKAWIDESSEGEGEFDEYPGDFSEEYYSMPAYVDLQASLNRLTQARTQVVRHASGTDELAILEAGAAYRAAIAESQVAMSRLQSRVPPDVFPDLALDVLASFDLDAGMMFHQWETGSVIMGAE
jgi:hypothetical protein